MLIALNRNRLYNILSEQEMKIISGQEKMKMIREMDIKDSFAVAITLLVKNNIITKEEYEDAKSKGHKGIVDMLGSKIYDLDKKGE